MKLKDFKNLFYRESVSFRVYHIESYFKHLNEHVSDIMHSTRIPARYKRGVGCLEGSDT